MASFVIGDVWHMASSPDIYLFAYLHHLKHWARIRTVSTDRKQMFSQMYLHLYTTSQVEFVIRCTSMVR